MPDMLLKGAVLLILAYIAGRGIGYLLSGSKAETLRPKPELEPEAKPLAEPVPAAKAPEVVEIVPVVEPAVMADDAPTTVAAAEADPAVEPAPIPDVAPATTAKVVSLAKARTKIRTEGPTAAELMAAEPASKPLAAKPAVKAKAALRARPQPAFAVSPLAAMSVAEVEAAVEKAGAPVEPARLKAAENGGPDPLLDIVGIGPVNEVQLHALGIYHFRQIAAWTPENIKWISERIKFPTRIVRENWMKQAAEFETAKK